MVRTFLKVYMELGSYFLFLQEQIKDIIILRNDLVQCDVDTVQYSLFNFGVIKFISGVNMYNLGVIVQPGCETSQTCEQDNLV
jgi:hypothetical protein